MSVNCLICRFDQHVEDAEFCQHCGVGLINFCSSTNCDLNDDERIAIDYQARFCPYCGSPSTFNENGYFEEK